MEKDEVSSESASDAKVGPEIHVKAGASQPPTGMHHAACSSNMHVLNNSCIRATYSSSLP